MDSAQSIVSQFAQIHGVNTDSELSPFERAPAEVSELDPVNVAMGSAS